MNLIAQFNLLYNNINSNASPGLSDDEICKFLNQAQDELIRQYFTPSGNKYQEGFDDSAIRQADFSGLIITATQDLETFDTTSPHLHPNGYLVKLDSAKVSEGVVTVEDTDSEEQSSSIATLKDIPIFLTINEWVQVTNGDNIISQQFQVTPLSYGEYERLMRKPYKLPHKSEAWRLNNNLTHNIEVILPIKKQDGQSLKYSIRYVRHPNEITSEDCELDPILHYELVQRAVELAKAAYTGDMSTQLTVGAYSGTNLGYNVSNK